MILRPLAGDLDGAHEAAEAGAGDQVVVVEQGIEQSGAEGVAATGRILDLVGSGGLHVLFIIARVNHAALTALGDYKGLDLARDLPP